LVSPGRPRSARDPQGETSRNVGRFLLFALFAVFVTIFYFGPDFAAEIAPRSMAVPFILGGWLPFLSYLSALGRQWRAPLILGIFVLVAGLAIIFVDNHAVRRVNAADTAGPNVDVKSISLPDAVTLWKRENNCSDSPATCPRPIIVAASGGASRAGFFVATKGPGGHHQTSGLYEVNIRLALPNGREVNVERTAPEDERHFDLTFAIDDAFKRARRRLQDQARRLQSQVKHHEGQPIGTVVRLDPSGEFGFLESGDGGEIYFHRNSVLDAAFSHLAPGTRVTFFEEMGEKGPQASTVTLLGKHKLRT